MKKVNFFLLLLGILLLFPVSHSPQSRPNSLYLELLGNGGLYSLNYERLFTENLGGRIGIMLLPNLDMVFYSVENLIVIPVMINYFIGSGSSKLELGGGIIFVSVTGGSVFGFHSDESASGTAGTATIGYRYQNPRNGILFKIGFTPIFSKEGFEPSGGLGFGIAF